MILPAVILKIVGFINQESQTLEKTPQKGGLVFCYTDKGTPVILEMTSNKKDLSEEDILSYFENKKNSVIKQKEIDTVAGELEYLEDFEIEFEEAVENFKKENKDRKALVKFKKEYKNNTALKIVNERREIKPGSIIRTVISIPNKGKTPTYKFKNKEYKKIQSRCLIFDNEGNPITSGLYYYSQTPNSLPISIEPIFNKDNQPLNLFKISLSKVATIDHYNHLIDHMIRSIARFIENEEKIFLPGIKYDYDYLKNKKEEFNLVKQISELSRKKEVTVKEGNNFIELILILKEKVNKNPKLILFIQPVFNLLLPPTFMESVKKENSPLTGLKKSMVSLNFSKEDPDKKRIISEKIERSINQLLSGDKKGEMISIYHTPAIKLSEPADSWGFMINNIQLEQFVLSSTDSFKLFKEIED